jgi:hypothetical protein
MIAIETQMDKKHKIGDKKLTVEYTEIIIIIIILIYRNNNNNINMFSKYINSF